MTLPVNPVALDCQFPVVELFNSQCDRTPNPINTMGFNYFAFKSGESGILASEMLFEGACQYGLKTWRQHDRDPDVILIAAAPR